MRDGDWSFWKDGGQLLLSQWCHQGHQVYAGGMREGGRD